MKKNAILMVALLAIAAIGLTSFANNESSRSELMQRNIDILVETVLDPRGFGGVYKTAEMVIEEVDRVYVSIDGQIYVCKGHKLAYLECGEPGGSVYCEIGTAFLTDVFDCSPVYIAR